MGRTPITDKVERGLVTCLHNDRERQCGNCPYYPCRNDKVKLRKDAVDLIQKLREIEWRRWNKDHAPPSPKQKVYIQYGVHWRRSVDKLPELGEVCVVTDGEHTWHVMQFNGTARYSGRLDDTPNPEDWLYKGAATTVKYWLPKSIALPPYPPEPSTEEDVIKEVVVNVGKQREKSRRRGTWIKDETCRNRYCCSYCHTMSAVKTDFCSHCGSRMTKGE